MTPDPDVIPANVPIARAAQMSVHHCRHTCIVDDEGALLDVISFRDVVHYIETYFDK
jgi:aminoglycoside phosphotransferase family enzyme